jgi:tetratricopeptide (TPR) repeat protein/predicted Ser/Thr protein kinase
MVPCPAELDLESFVRGSLPAETSAWIESHVSGCERCRSSIGAIRADDLLLDEVGRVLVADAREETPPLVAGSVVAGFMLLREIGRGGMGAVWEAEQQQPRRRVALKVVRPGRVSAGLRRRLEHEAEILAKLQHRGIAQVFAAGSFETPRGVQPWFAMERIDGRPLLEFCSTLGLRERLCLLIEICDAVQHAHQRGVIHRDLKPANILVDAGGLPKVLDFGVATAGEAGPDIAGTPDYMSPEQRAGGEIDTRSDVFALGVVGFEVLTGRLPHALAGELGSILGRATAKDREQRYPSAAALAEDLGRLLRHEPVGAHPPSAGYLLRKFARRNRAVVIGALAVFTTLVAGVVTTWTQLTRAEEQLEIASGTRDFLQEVLMLASPGEQGGEPPSIMKALEVALGRVEGAERHRVVEAAVRHVLGEILLAMGRYQDAESHLRRALALYQQEYGAEHKQVLYVLSHLARTLQLAGRIDDAEAVIGRALSMRDLLAPQHAPILGGALTNLGAIHYAAGRLDQAEAAFREGLAVFEEVEREDQRRVNLAITRGSLAQILAARGRLDEAGALFAEVVAEHRVAFGPQSPYLANVLTNSGEVLRQRGQLEEAEALLREALEIVQQKFGDEHERSAGVRRVLGLVRFERGAREEGLALGQQAAATLRKALGDHVRVAQALNSVCTMLERSEDWAAAEACAQDALAVAEKKLGPQHPVTNEARLRLGACRHRLGRADQAEPLLRRALELYQGPLAWQHELAARARAECDAAAERKR